MATTNENNDVPLARQYYDEIFASQHKAIEYYSGEYWLRGLVIDEYYDLIFKITVEGRERWTGETVTARMLDTIVDPEDRHDLLHGKVVRSLRGGTVELGPKLDIVKKRTAIEREYWNIIAHDAACCTVLARQGDTLHNRDIIHELYRYYDTTEAAVVQVLQYIEDATDIKCVDDDASAFGQWFVEIESTLGKWYDEKVDSLPFGANYNDVFLKMMVNRGFLCQREGVLLTHCILGGVEFFETHDRRHNCDIECFKNVYSHVLSIDIARHLQSDLRRDFNKSVVRGIHSRRLCSTGCDIFAYCDECQLCYSSYSEFRTFHPPRVHYYPCIVKMWFHFDRGVGDHCCKCGCDYSPRFSNLHLFMCKRVRQFNFLGGQQPCERERILPPVPVYCEKLRQGARRQRKVEDVLRYTFTPLYPPLPEKDLNWRVMSEQLITRPWDHRPSDIDRKTTTLECRWDGSRECMTNLARQGHLGALYTAIERECMYAENEEVRRKFYFIASCSTSEHICADAGYTRQPGYHCGAPLHYKYGWSYGARKYIEKYAHQWKCDQRLEVPRECEQAYNPVDGAAALIGNIELNPGPGWQADSEDSRSLLSSKLDVAEGIASGSSKLVKTVWTGLRKLFNIDMPARILNNTVMKDATIEVETLAESQGDYIDDLSVFYGDPVDDLLEVLRKPYTFKTITLNMGGIAGTRLFDINVAPNRLTRNYVANDPTVQQASHLAFWSQFYSYYGGSIVVEIEPITNSFVKGSILATYKHAGIADYNDARAGDSIEVLIGDGSVGRLVVPLLTANDHNDCYVPGTTGGEVTASAFLHTPLIGGLGAPTTLEVNINIMAGDDFYFRGAQTKIQPFIFWEPSGWQGWQADVELKGDTGIRSTSGDISDSIERALAGYPGSVTEILSRWYAGPNTFTLGVNVQVGTSYPLMTFPDMVNDSDLNLQGLMRSHTFLRSSVEVRVIVNSSLYHSGCVEVFALPSGYTPVDYDENSYGQVDALRLDLAHRPEGILKVGWRDTTRVIKTTQASTFVVYLRVRNRIMAATGVETALTVRYDFRLVNASVQVQKAWQSEEIRRVERNSIDTTKVHMSIRNLLKRFYYVGIKKLDIDNSQQISGDSQAPRFTWFWYQCWFARCLLQNFGFWAGSQRFRVVLLGSNTGIYDVTHRSTNFQYSGDARGYVREGGVGKVIQFVNTEKIINVPYEQSSLTVAAVEGNTADTLGPGLLTFGRVLNNEAGYLKYYWSGGDDFQVFLPMPNLKVLVNRTSAPTYTSTCQLREGQRTCESNNREKTDGDWLMAGIELNPGPFWSRMVGDVVDAQVEKQKKELIDGSVGLIADRLPKVMGAYVWLSDIITNLYTIFTSENSVLQGIAFSSLGMKFINGGSVLQQLEEAISLHSRRGFQSFESVAGDHRLVEGISLLVLSGLISFVGYQITHSDERKLKQLLLVKLAEGGGVLFKINQGLTGIQGLYQKCIVGIKAAFKYFLYGHTELDEIESRWRSESSEWYDDTATFLNVYENNVGKIVREGMLERLDKLAQGAAEFRRIEAQWKEAPRQYGILASRLLSLFDRVDKGRHLSRDRMEPIGIMLQGEPGGGKSVLATHILPRLVLGKCGLLKEGDDVANHRYTIPFGRDGFMSGYLEQPWAIIDDFGQGSAEDDRLEALTLISTAPYEVSKPSLSDKGMPFTSPFVVVTTNINDFGHSNNLKCPEALARRFPFTVRVSARGEFDFGDVIQKCKDATNFNELCSTLDTVWTLHRPARGMRNGQPVPIGQFVAEIVERYAYKVHCINELEKLGFQSGELKEIQVSFMKAVNESIECGTYEARKTLWQNEVAKTSADIVAMGYREDSEISTLIREQRALPISYDVFVRFVRSQLVEQRKAGWKGLAIICAAVVGIGALVGTLWSLFSHFLETFKWQAYDGEHRPKFRRKKVTAPEPGFQANKDVTGAVMKHIRRIFYKSPSEDIYGVHCFAIDSKHIIVPWHWYIRTMKKMEDGGAIYLQLVDRSGVVSGNQPVSLGALNVVRLQASGFGVDGLLDAGLVYLYGANVNHVKKIDHLFPNRNDMKRYGTSIFNFQLLNRGSVYTAGRTDGQGFRRCEGVIMLRGKVNEETMPGQCGQPYVVGPNNPRPILGLHSYLFTGSIGMTPITSEAIAEGRRKLEELMGHIVTPACTEEEVALEYYQDEDVVEHGMEITANIVNGVEMKRFNPTNTAFVRTRIEQPDAWDCDFGPSAKGPGILEKNCVKFTDIGRRTVTLQVVIPVVRNMLKQYPDGIGRVLTFHETLNGAEGLEQIVLETGSGYWATWCKYGKSEWFDTEIKDEGKVIVGFSEKAKTFVCPLWKCTMQERYEGCEQMLKEGVVPFFLWVATCKDEVVKRAKIEKGKTRVFVQPPLELTLLIRRYFGHFCGWFRSHPSKDRRSAIGIDAVADWRWLLDELVQNNDDGCDCDYEEWDGRYQSLNFEVFERVVNQFYQDDHRQVRAGLIYALQYSPILVGCHIYHTYQANKSGNPMTDIMNTVGNGFLIESVYQVCRLRSGMRVDPGKFDDNIVCFTYGDDVIMSVTEDAQTYFQLDKVKEIMEALGYKVTSAIKEGSLEFRPVKDLQFLQRHFREEDGVVFGPLTKSHIYRELLWERKSVVGDERVFDERVRCGVEMMAHHGKNEVNALVDELNKQKIDVEFKYEEYKNDLYVKQQVKSDKVSIPPSGGGKLSVFNSFLLIAFLLCIGHCDGYLTCEWGQQLVCVQDNVTIRTDIVCQVCDIWRNEFPARTRMKRSSGKDYLEELSEEVVELADGVIMLKNGTVMLTREFSAHERQVARITYYAYAVAIVVGLGCILILIGAGAGLAAELLVRYRGNRWHLHPDDPLIGEERGGGGLAERIAPYVL